MEADDYFRGPYLSTIEHDGLLDAGIESIYTKILQDLETRLRPGELLDVGCAMGHFMAQAKRRGWTVSGTECSGYAAEYARDQKKLNVRAVCELREAGFAEASFDACVLIEVAEHLPDPRQTLTEAFRVLKPGGILYVTTPNFSCYRSQLQGSAWSAVIPTGHLFYFTGTSMGQLLNSIGFTGIIDLTPAADFSSDLAALQAAKSVESGPHLSRERADEIERLRRRAAEEDAGKLSNGRGEGLVFWAVKPVPQGKAASATVRTRQQGADLEGKLVTLSGSTPEDQKVYFVKEGRKYWATSVEWLDRRGMRLADTIRIDKEQLNSLLPGPDLR